MVLPGKTGFAGLAAEKISESFERVKKALTTASGQRDSAVIH
jgi:predicted ATPase with chaperone activity